LSITFKKCYRISKVINHYLFFANIIKKLGLNYFLNDNFSRNLRKYNHKSFIYMNSSASVAIKYGILTTAGLIGYFLIIKLLNLHTNPWFRLLNGLVMAYGIYAAIKRYKLVSGTTFNYINGFKVGILSGFLATFVFALFMGIYMFHFDTAFMNTLLQDWFQDIDYGGGILIFVIIIEGLASTAILALTFMQVFKNSTKIIQNQ